VVDLGQFHRRRPFRFAGEIFKLRWRAVTPVLDLYNKQSDLQTSSVQTGSVQTANAFCR